MLLPFRVLPSVFRRVWEEEEEEDEEDNDDEEDDDDDDDEEVSSRLTLIWTHAVLTVLHKTILLPFRVLPSVFRRVWEEEEEEDDEEDEDEDDDEDDEDEDDEAVSSRLTLIWTHVVLNVLHKTILLPFRVLPSVFRRVWEEEEEDDNEDDDDGKRLVLVVSSRLTRVSDPDLNSCSAKRVTHNYSLTFQSASFSLQTSVRGGGGWWWWWWWGWWGGWWWWWWWWWWWRG